MFFLFQCISRTMENVVEEISSFFTGTGSDLPIISGTTDLCESHEKMEDMADFSIWIDDFIPMSCSQRCLIESLLWHLHSEGICCAILGIFPTYLADKLKQLSFACLYIATYGSPESKIVKTILQYGTVSRYFTLGELKFTVLSPDEPRGYIVIGNDETSVKVLAISVESMRSCGRRSNLNLVKHVWETCFPFIGTPYLSFPPYNAWFMSSVLGQTAMGGNQRSVHSVQNSSRDTVVVTMGALRQPMCSLLWPSHSCKTFCNMPT